jgi:hypothetical protein
LMYTYIYFSFSMCNRAVALISLMYTYIYFSFSICNRVVALIFFTVVFVVAMLDPRVSILEMFWWNCFMMCAGPF